MELKKRRKIEIKEETKELQESVEKRRTISDSLEEPEVKSLYTPIDTSIVISTGCTLLDLAISGGRVRGGGIPGGIMVEIAGPSGSGKTALAVDIAASVQNKGGEADFLDPEARLDKEYARIYGAEINKENYSRPKLVKEVFDQFLNWEPKNKKVINVKICDSIAALVSDLEMTDEGDKRGQKKAKDLHAGCRKVSVEIANEYKLIVFTNQEFKAEYGTTTPGGNAVPFYTSLRISVRQKGKIEPEKKLSSGKIVKAVIGVESECTVIKSSVDNGYRTAPIYIIYGHGIDDVRGNLQYYKDMTKGTKYLAVDKEYQALNSAIQYIEANNLEGELREMVIDLWEEIQDKFKIDRKRKVRF